MNDNIVYSPNTILTKYIYTNMNDIKKSNQKVSNDFFNIPSYDKYNDIIKYNYNVQQLKKICKYYKQKQSGNKNDLVFRIFNYMRLSYFAIKIQSIYRGYLQRRLNKLKGRSLFKRELATNTDELISLDPIKTIHPTNYFSYDIKNHNYGFDIAAIYNIVLKNNVVTNPYNRETLSNQTIFYIKEVIRISKILKQILSLSIDNSIINNDKFKIIEIFHTIDSFGNLSNYNWFYSLSKMQLMRLYRELYDIWHYRVQLTDETKKLICHPTGRPFARTDSLFLMNYTVPEIHKHFITIFNNLLTKAIDSNYQSLGAYYILGALTIINTEAATALPWLYETFII